jgi:hypothetical protein
METARWCWSASSSSQPHVTRLAEIVHATRRRPTYSTLLLHLRRCGNRSHLTCHRDELVALRRSSSACRCFACRVRHLSPHPVGSLAASMIITSFKVVLLVFSVVASSKRKFMFWPLPCGAPHRGGDRGQQEAFACVAVLLLFSITGSILIEVTVVPTPHLRCHSAWAHRGHHCRSPRHRGHRAP